MKPIWNQIYRETLAEFISIFVLTAMQTGLIASYIIGNKTDHPEQNAFSAAVGCGLVVMVAVYIGGGVSGAHINPAVTSTLAILGRTPWIKVPFYFVAQYLGAFVGAAATNGVYKGAMKSYPGEYNDLAGIYTTFPAKFLSAENAMLDSTFSTALLLLLILAITDKKNMNLPPSMSPFFFGLLVATIGLGFSYNCGNPMNPARDLSPRLWAVVSGHGTHILHGSNDYVWWWIPVVFPHVGGIIGGLIYVVLIELHHPDDVEGTDQKTEKVIAVQPQDYNGQLKFVDTTQRSSVILQLAQGSKCELTSPEIEPFLPNDEKIVKTKGCGNTAATTAL